MNDTIIIPSIINEAYFKQYSPLPSNYNIDDIRPYFNIAEQIWVKPILGEPLYEELLEQVVNNNVSEENSTLLLMVYPYLAYSITYEALPFIGYHLTEVGITKGKSENSDSVSINDINYINTHIRAQVEAMKTMFKKWLNDHADSYPMYTPDDCACSFIPNDCTWIEQYYNGGYALHPWKYFANANRPNTRLQCYTTRRPPIDLV